MKTAKKSETIDGKHSLKYYKDCRYMGIITLLLTVWYILDPPGETSWSGFLIILLAIGVVGNMIFTCHRKIKTWEKEHSTGETETLKYPNCKNHIEFKISRDKKEVFRMEDEDFFEENPSTSSATMSTSVKKAEFIPKASPTIPITPEDYDTLRQKGDYENSYEILKASLITRLNKMHRTQNPNAERDTLDLFSIIKTSRNFLEKSGLFIEEKIDIYIDKMKFIDIHVEDGGLITPSLYDEIENMMVDIYMEFKWKFEEYQMMD